MGRNKRRVQAQRKFALGAYIPPQSSTVNTRSEDNAAAHAREDRTAALVQVSKHNPKTLLDLVSFQRLHSHFEPVVLIERLLTTVRTQQTTIEKPKLKRNEKKGHTITKSKKPIKGRKSAKVSAVSSDEDEDERPLKFFKLDYSKLGKRATKQKKSSLTRSPSQMNTRSSKAQHRISPTHEATAVSLEENKDNFDVYNNPVPVDETIGEKDSENNSSSRELFKESNSVITRSRAVSRVRSRPLTVDDGGNSKRSSLESNSVITRSRSRAVSRACSRRPTVDDGGNSKRSSLESNSVITRSRAVSRACSRRPTVDDGGNSKRSSLESNSVITRSQSVRRTRSRRPSVKSENDPTKTCRPSDPDYSPVRRTWSIPGSPHLLQSDEDLEQDRLIWQDDDEFDFAEQRNTDHTLPEAMYSVPSTSADNAEEQNVIYMLPETSYSEPSTSTMYTEEQDNGYMFPEASYEPSTPTHYAENQNPGDTLPEAICWRPSTSKVSTKYGLAGDGLTTGFSILGDFNTEIPTPSSWRLRSSKDVGEAPNNDNGGLQYMSSQPSTSKGLSNPEVVVPSTTASKISKAPRAESSSQSGNQSVCSKANANVNRDSECMWSQPSTSKGLSNPEVVVPSTTASKISEAPRAEASSQSGNQSVCSKANANVNRDSECMWSQPSTSKGLSNPEIAVQQRSSKSRIAEALRDDSPCSDIGDFDVYSQSNDNFIEEHDEKQDGTSTQNRVDTVPNTIYSEPTTSKGSSNAVIPEPSSSNTSSDDDEEDHNHDESDSEVMLLESSTSKDDEEDHNHHDSDSEVMLLESSTSKDDEEDHNHDDSDSEVMLLESSTSKDNEEEDNNDDSYSDILWSQPSTSKGPSNPVVAVPSTSKTGTSAASRVSSLRKYKKCSSANIRTVADVLNASEETLTNLCKTCDVCIIIDSILKLRTQLRPKRPHNSTDVYDFDPQSDDSARVAPFHSQRKRRKGRQTTGNSSKDIKKALHKNFFLEGTETWFNSLLQTAHKKTWSKMSKGSKFKTVLTKRKHPKEKGKGIGKKGCAAKPSNSRECGPSAGAERPNPSAQTAQTEENTTGPDSTYGKIIEAPTFELTEEEFNDPIVFLTRLLPMAEKYAICKIKAPASFKPKCNLPEDMLFDVSKQHISRMYNRGSHASRESIVMKYFLASQKIYYNRGPLVEGIEINLYKLYNVVQSYGGLEQVEQKRRWKSVAEDMNLSERSKTKLENLYVKYILPYDTASVLERQQALAEVDKRWARRYKKMLKCAANPLHTQKKLLGESDSSEDEEEENDYLTKVLKDFEDCITPGRKMQFSSFKKMAKYIMDMAFPNGATVQQVEETYWQHVLRGKEHIVVNAASIDTGTEGYGFSKNKQKDKDPLGKHPWNLKMLINNGANVLRTLGNVLGLTVPTLHFCMILATSCWHRDPHGLAWIEYLHEGAVKIWYGIPTDQSENFRRAVAELCPAFCQNKPIWLPSDIAMIPPELLKKYNVTLSRVEQKPGEYVVVFPRAYTCSVSTGLSVSESVYWANTQWLTNLIQVFQELRESCEPTAFAVEQLLIALSKNKSLPMSVQQLVYDNLKNIMLVELNNRELLIKKGLRTSAVPLGCHTQLRGHKKAKTHAWNVRDLDDCQICRTTLYLSKVTGITGKKVPLCPAHALRLLGTAKYNYVKIEDVQLITYFSDAQLDEIMSSFKKRLPNA